MNIMNNLSWWTQAKKVIASGVNSPVRAFIGLDIEPVFINHAAGPYLYDINGKQYIDYVCSWGATILGHSNQELLSIIQKTINN